MPWQQLKRIKFFDYTQKIREPCIKVTDHDTVTHGYALVIESDSFCKAFICSQ